MVQIIFPPYPRRFPVRPGVAIRECENQANSDDSVAADPVVRVPRRVLDLVPLLLRRAPGLVPAALEVRLDLFEPAGAGVRAPPGLPPLPGARLGPRVLAAP